MSEVERIRLFVAVSVPRTELAWLQDQASDLRGLWPEARWTTIENQHVTLKFLGPTPTDRLDAVARVVDSVARGRPGGTLRLAGLGAFPTENRARVLWCGLDDPGGVLGGLAADLALSFESLGFAAEQRPFRPHLTLARFKVPQRVAGRLPDLAAHERPAFRIDDIHLFRSRLHPKGARYEILRTFPLPREADNPHDAKE